MLAKVSTVTVFGLSAQLFGLLRMAIIAYTFGLSAQVDAYYLGLAIPSLLALVFGNWLQLTFLGRYTTLLIQEQPASAHTFKITMLLLGALVAVHVDP